MSMHRAAFRKKSVYTAFIVGAVAVVLLISSLCVGGYAYLKWQSEKVENSFKAADSKTPSVGETFENTVKNDVYVYVGDTGYSVYVRASVVAVWKDASTGNVLYTAPELGVDYSLTRSNDDWFFYNGYYYYKHPVNSGEQTTNLIDKCNLLVSPKPGYNLEIKIVSQTIQSEGTTDIGDIPAVTREWGVSVNSTTYQLQIP